MPAINTQSINSLNTDRQTILDNEAGSLDNDDFLKLLLVELQHQDPTEPMDSAKILAQTSQLATLEAQNKTTLTMEALSKQFSATNSMTSLGAIGRTAILNDTNLNIGSSGSIEFEIQFNQNVKSGTLEIRDSNDNLVKELKLDEMPAGVHNFNWEGLNESEERVAEGAYTAVAKYTDGTSGNFTDRYGEYRIGSVKFDGSTTLLKMGSNYVPFSSIGEIKY